MKINLNSSVTIFAMFHALVLSSCEKAPTDLAGNYLGSVSSTQTTEMFNPPMNQQFTSNSVMQATVYIQDGSAFVDCAYLCEDVKLKNGKASINCTENSNSGGVDQVTTTTGQIMATGTSLQFDLTRISEGSVSGVLATRITTTYVGTIPKM